MKDPKRVFLVHGRDQAAHQAVVLFLRALRLDPLDFNEIRDSLGGSPFVGDIIQRGMEQCKCILVLLTPDEHASLRPSLCSAHDSDSEKHRWQARPNVLIEAGMALALDQNATILAVLGNVSLPSDVAGRHFIRIDNSTDARENLKNALVGAGCEIPARASGWHDKKVAGDFDSAISALPGVSVRSPFR